MRWRRPRPATPPGARAVRAPLEGIPVLVKDNVAGGRDGNHGGLPGPARGPAAGRVHRLPAARGRRRHPGQGEPVGVGELPLHPLDQWLVDPRRPDRQPLRARPQPVRLEFGIGGRPVGRPGAARRRHRDRRLDRLPVQRLRRGRRQADPSGWSAGAASCRCRSLRTPRARWRPRWPTPPRCFPCSPPPTRRTARPTTRDLVDYAGFLDAGALEGARVGIWRAASASAGAATEALLDVAVGLPAAPSARSWSTRSSCPTSTRSPSPSSRR